MSDPVEYEEEDIDYDEDLSPTIEDKPLTGVVRYRDADGFMFMSISYLNGIRHGRLRKYFPNGNVRFELLFEHGVLTGIGRAWHENGQLKAEVLYEWRRPVSSREWDADGKEIVPASADPIDTR
jgi:antitoxin component YwqK of YwqJK toxin-antitoxin module